MKKIENISRALILREEFHLVTKVAKEVGAEIKWAHCPQTLEQMDISGVYDFIPAETVDYKIEFQNINQAVEFGLKRQS